MIDLGSAAFSNGPAIIFADRVFVGDIRTTVGSGSFPQEICWPGDLGCAMVTEECGAPGGDGSCPPDSHPCPPGHQPSTASAAVGCERCRPDSISPDGTTCAACPEGQEADSRGVECVDKPTEWEVYVIVALIVLIALGVAGWFW